MISDRALNQLRMAAALVHELSFGVRLAHGDRPVVAVNADPGPDAVPMTPCQFRCAVGRAWAHRRAGQRIGMCGLPTGHDPDVEVVPPPGSQGHPGDVYEVPAEDRALYVVATTASPGRCRALVTADVACTADPFLTTSLVHVLARPHDAGAVELLQGVLAVLSTEEVLVDVAGGLR